jgi:hypothetical protein
LIAVAGVVIDGVVAGAFFAVVESVAVVDILESAVVVVFGKSVVVRLVVADVSYFLQDQAAEASHQQAIFLFVTEAAVFVVALY